MCPYLLLENFGFYKTGLWLFPGVLEGLGSSGKLVGTISTYPGTYKCPGSRVMTKNPWGVVVSKATVLGKKNPPSTVPC